MVDSGEGKMSLDDFTMDPNASVDHLSLAESVMENEEHSKLLRRMKIISSLIMIGCCSAGICGNLISSFIFLHPTMRSSPVNFLLAAVSLIDTVVLALIVPMLILPGINFYFENESIYRFYLTTILALYPIALMSQTTSSWTYVLVSFERYLAVCQPLKTYKLLTLNQAKKAQLIIVILSIAYNIVRFWEYRRSSNGQIEEYLRSKSFYFLFYYTSLHLVTHFLLPLSMIVVLNVRIIRTLTSRQNGQLPLRRWAAEFNTRRQNRTAWMIVMATGAFAVTNTLTFFVTAWEALEPDVLGNSGQWTITIHAVSDMANILLTSHSTLSFFIYVSYCRQYRCLFQRFMIHLKIKAMNIFRGTVTGTTANQWQRVGTTDAHYAATEDGDGIISVYRTRTLSTLTSFVSR